MNPMKRTYGFWLQVQLWVALAVGVSSSALAGSGCTLKSSPPVPVCGQRGTVSNPNENQISLDSAVSTQADCLTLCYHRAYTGEASQGKYEYCRYFGFDSASNTCLIWNKNSAFQANASSPYVYSDIGCYDCPDICPSAADENLLDNGGFEFSNKLYGPWRAGPSTSAKIVSHGSNSGNAATFDYSISQSRNLCTAQTYLVTFDIAFGDAVDADRSFEVGDYRVGFSRQINSNYTSWRRVAGSFQYGLIYSLLEVSSVSAQFTGSAVRVDNVAIRVAASEYQTTGPSLLENGGFESGELAPWHASSYYRYKGPHGKNKLVQPGLTSGSNNNYAFLHVQNFKYYRSTDHSQANVLLTQNFTTTEGVFYQLSFDYRTRRANHIKVTAGRSQWELFKKHVSFPNRVEPFRRIFTGSGKTEVFSIFVEGSFDGHEIRKGRYLFDNIEIKALANQAIA